jgi:hypothetical protein
MIFTNINSAFLSQSDKEAAYGPNVDTLLVAPAS